MLIGVCGKAGSGKDTVGTHLVDKYRFERVALADPIRRIVQDIFVLDDKTVYDRVEREKELEHWEGWTVRTLLQFIGTELFRDNIVDDIWVRSLWLRIKENPHKNYVITDIRFPNELNFFKEKYNGNFISIKVERDGCVGNDVGLGMHKSEQYDLDTDYVIDNNETIYDLNLKVDKIINKSMLT